MTTTKTKAWQRRFFFVSRAGVRADLGFPLSVKLDWFAAAAGGSTHGGDCARSDHLRSAPGPLKGNGGKRKTLCVFPQNEANDNGGMSKISGK